MAAYLFADLTVHDPEGIAEYRRRVPDVIAQYGGRYLVRGGAMQILEGSHQADRIVIVEFPDMASARKFYESPEYAELIPMRQANARSDVLLVEGYDG